MRISDWSSDVCSSDLGQPGRRAVVRRRDAERADRGGVKARHAPELARHLDRRGLAVGAGHRDAGCREAGKEACGDTGEGAARIGVGDMDRSEEHTSELHSLMRISYAVFCLKKKKKKKAKA